MGYECLEQKQTKRSIVDEFAKSSCENDLLGTRCSSCPRRGTSKCFNPEKEKNHGWKWN